MAASCRPLPDQIKTEGKGEKDAKAQSYQIGNSDPTGDPTGV